MADKFYLMKGRTAWTCATSFETVDFWVGSLKSWNVAQKLVRSEDKKCNKRQLEQQNRSSDRCRTNKCSQTATLIETDQLTSSCSEVLTFNSRTKCMCTICRRKHQIYLTEQSKVHSGEKSFDCPHCEKIFSKERALKQHLSIHTGIKPYSCSVCSHKFVRKYDLMRHTRTHTDERPYTCGVCGKAFGRNSSLKMHQYIHTGIKPYSCSQCDARFVNSGDLNIHLRSHSGVKPYICEQCGKCFAKKSTLSVHLRTHTGIKPYCCDGCGKTFSQTANKNRHTKSCSLSNFLVKVNSIRYICKE